MNGQRIRSRSRRELASQRRTRRHGCWDHLIAVPLWPMYDVNLGTLLRTCDAVGACLAVPRLPWVPGALAKGNTLRRPACVHWTGRDPCQWLREQRSHRPVAWQGTLRVRPPGIPDRRDQWRERWRRSSVAVRSLAAISSTESSWPEATFMIRSYASSLVSVSRRPLTP